MPAKTVQLRSVALLLGDEWWALQKRHVTGVAAEVVLRVRVGDAPERDVVVQVPPIDVQQLAEAQGLDRNTAAMVLALARVEDAVADRESLEPVPSVLLVEPDPSGRPSVSRDVIARARKLLAWEPVQRARCTSLPADDLTVAVTVGQAYWHVATLRADSPPEAREPQVVFVRREPAMQDHCTYHASGVLHHKREGLVDAERLAQRLPLRWIEQFVTGAVLDLSAYRERHNLRPGRRSLALRTDAHATTAPLVDMYLIPPGEEAQPQQAFHLSLLRGATGVTVLCRDTAPWLLVHVIGSSPLIRLAAE